MIPLQDIHPSPINPRKRFDEEAIGELAASIAEHGLLQPITVAPWTDGYVIVAGERRWRACQSLGLKEVPCIIRPVGAALALKSPLPLLCYSCHPPEHGWVRFFLADDDAPQATTPPENVEHTAGLEGRLGSVGCRASVPGSGAAGIR